MFLPDHSLTRAMKLMEGKEVVKKIEDSYELEEILVYEAARGSGFHLIYPRR
jgi:hypothetical protein